MKYDDFLNNKGVNVDPVGFNVHDNEISSVPFPHQRDIVKWALKMGRCAVFADTGLGKTVVFGEIIRILKNRFPHKRVLIVSPISLSKPTSEMLFDLLELNVNLIRDGRELSDINIINYESLHKLNPNDFDVLILDESSILKNHSGKYRSALVDFAKNINWRFAFSATPSPNDIIELGNHAEFLGIMKMAEMQATFFYNTGDISERWLLRPHARKSFYEWVNSWAFCIRKPSDLGYNDDNYILPKLNIKTHFIDTGWKEDGYLIQTKLSGITGRNKVARDTIEQRCKEAANIVNELNGEQCVIWCNRITEANLMAKLLPNSCNVSGSDSHQKKEESFSGFVNGEIANLITKPKIGGFGMNWQHCNQMVFVGLTDSWEMFYQCIRRCYRFGQTEEVNVYIVLDKAQIDIFNNVMRKQREADDMMNELVESGKTNRTQQNGKYKYRVEYGKDWTAYLGDSAEVLKKLDTESIDHSVFSPPFYDLFTWNNSYRDLANCHNTDEFNNHFGYIIDELYRIIKTGRNLAVHVADLPTLKWKDGYIGMRDFPGDMIRLFESHGFIWAGRAFIQKNPALQATRNKVHGLMFKQLKKDSLSCRPAVGDQILFFRKPGEPSVPVTPVDNGETDEMTWMKSWANSIWCIDDNDNEFLAGTIGYWHDIRESDTLQYKKAKSSDDIKHITPLQLEVIKRCISLFSNPGETVLTPFGGIGSEAYQAIKMGRKAVSIELNENYYKVSLKNLRRAEEANSQMSLFDLIA